MKDEKKVFLGLGVFFGIILIANLTLIYLSVKTSDGLVEENYYTKGLNYEQKITGDLKQNKLGWQISFQNLRENERSFCIVSAKDKKGSPISNAKVSLSFFRPTESGFDRNLNLNETVNGIYKGQIDFPVPGIWDVNIEIQKDSDKWKKKQRIKIAP